MVEIYHNKQFLSYMMDKTVNPLDLEHVANVNTNELEVAFITSQNIGEPNDPWINNSTVEAVKPGIIYRSTSVGDVLKRDGKFYVIEMVGYNEIDIDEENIGVV
jgi:hypothetical protein